MTLNDDIRKRAVLVDDVISEHLSGRQPDGLYMAMRHLIDAGGKRLRPFMLTLSAGAVGGRATSVLPAAAAIELVHTFTLIHDDIMDNDDLRRGLPAVHVKWGTSGAILAGDTLYSKAFELISSMKSDPDRVVECIRILSKTCTDICEGQWLDVDFEKRDDVTEDEYIRMVEKKTAVLYASAAKIGAILGGGSKKEAEALYEFGRCVGIGFQIHDDMIDLISPEEVIGKVRGSDLMEGKRTLIAIHALSHNASIDIFGRGEATRDEIDEALCTLERSGSIEYARRKALQFVEKGKASLESLRDTKAKRQLVELADYMITRQH